MKKHPSLFVALIPVIFLIVLLSINVIWVYGDDALSGSNQFILLLSGAFAAVVGVSQGFTFKKIIKNIILLNILKVLDLVEISVRVVRIFFGI